MAATLSACLVLCAGCGGSSRRLILLVSTDTLRADELGAYGSERQLTPHLDALADESVVFQHAYAPAAFTLPSVAALHTGRYPEELGIRSNESAVPDGAGSLASELVAAGWRTRAVVGNFVLRRSSGMAQGFERFDDTFPGRESGSRAMPERSAAATTDAALAALEDCSHGPPCFVWVHYQDPHGPYDPPDAWRSRAALHEPGAPDSGRELPLGRDQWGRGSIPAYQVLGERRDVAFYRVGYRGEIAFTDAELGRLLDALPGLGLAEEAVIVFAADHGESLGEHDLWFSHGTHLGDEQVRVPLMIRAPGLAPGVRDDPVSLVDLWPTLLAMVGSPAGAGNRSGRDLLAPGAEAAAGGAYMANLGVGGTARYAIVDGGFKFVATERGGLHDGRLHRLGDESVDLTAAAPQLASKMRQRLVELRARVASDVPETPQRLDESDRARLRELGYLGEEAPPQGADR